MKHIEALLDGFRAAAAAGERARAIPPESVAAMLDAGLSRMLLPRRFGGDEQGLDVWFDVVRAVARADASHGWCASLIMHMPHYAAYLPLAGQERLWAGGPDIAIAGSLPPACRVESVDGGYRVTGRCAFASGVRHSAWSFVGGLLPAGEWAWFLLPADAYEVADTWFTIGMRGTGSNTIVTDAAFVPEDCVLRAAHVIEGDVPGPAPSANPMYRLPIAAYGPLGFSTTILGAVEGAIDEFRGWMATRRAPDGSRLAERPRYQRALGALGADADAAALLLRRVVETAQAPDPPDVAARARSLRDMAHAAQLCVRAVDELMAMSGTAAFAQDSVIGRAWRDAHFAAANLGIAADGNYGHWGRLTLGLERDPAMVIH